MNLNKNIIISFMLVMCFLFTGCGEDKTIYDSASTTPTTDNNVGASLFSSKCANCHGEKNVGGSVAKVAKPTSVSVIKSANMSLGLTDDQLSEVVTYINGL